ncbi:LETM1-related biofilm-associated protein [Arenibacter sp. GZD96]|uniref:LETM1-related biofilm-associated protein n=1 Tax=Aurantibrevibacter litoralis TaxID=3106030 RepID=UPI002AFF7D0E|nr:LETM1-related biofilm-associated protein [Arenibacter sp. GZD-96]MEA1786129.1 LETM1-related biofilm-associated protein [Arenibacter sp. GZD-96]
MNPSSAGWIDKFGSLVGNNLCIPSSFWTLYGDLKKRGFVYGINVQIPEYIVFEHALTEDEKAKINLLEALYSTYHLSCPQQDFPAFLERIFSFYKSLEVGKRSFFDKLLTGKKTSSQLEKLIDSRIYLEDNVLSRNFNSIITNSLLLIDVLTFKYYLEGGEALKTHAQELEYVTINITYHALNSKEKNKNDARLAQLFAASLTYIESESQHFDGSYRARMINKFNVYENQYFLDVACLTVWEDHSLDYKESEFIFGIGKDLGFSTETIATALDHVSQFFEENVAQIPFLKDANLAVQFYDSMSKIVNKLILRNSKRLQKELSESKELVSLLSKSTLRDLSPEEKKKVQNQLLDIFKSIPSLAIFMLPGGAVLLPIFIKLIPKLLPSSFDENRI